MKSKYIVFENRYDVETIVIFDGSTPHPDVLSGINKIIAAGFLNIKTGECYGKSTGLEVESRGEPDSKLARRFLQLDQ